MNAKFLSANRGYVRTKVTKLSNEIAERAAGYTRSQIKLHKEKLKDYRDELVKLDSQILELLWDDKNTENEELLYKERTASAAYVEKILISQSILDENLSRLSNETLPSAPVPVGRSEPNLIRPSAPLPKYSGDISESLENFLSEFEQVISHYKYTDYEKFTLLRGQVSNRALLILETLETDKRSYDSARDLLKKAFGSLLNQKFDTIEKLARLKLPRNGDPLVYAAELRTIKDAFNRLEIKTSEVLQYFVWQSMPHELKRQFVSITNKSKPSFDDLDKNLFDAIERYQEETKYSSSLTNSNNSSKQTKSTSSYALSIEYDSTLKKRKQCAYCDSSDHSYRSCTIYKLPQEKLRRVKELNGCIRCGFTNHKISECRFKNVSCSQCRGNHFTCLCVKYKETNSSSSIPVVSSDETGSNSIYHEYETPSLEVTDRGNNRNNYSTKRGKNRNSKNKEVTDSKNVSKSIAAKLNVCARPSDNAGHNVVLPTATAYVNRRKLRILKDSGSSANFIDENVARQLKLQIVERDFPLTVSGFNISREYKSNIVKVPIRFSRQTYFVRAFCIPRIDLVLDLPNLGSLYAQLSAKGYKLADKDITEKSVSIRDVTMIIGAESSICLSSNSILFGDKNPSMLAESRCGILLEGDVANYLRNLPKLRHNQSANNSSQVSPGKICAYGASIPSKVTSNFVVLNEDGTLNEKELLRATDAALTCPYDNFYDDHELNDNYDELNSDLVNFALDNCRVDGEGRLQMPILWNGKVDYLLGNNDNLAHAILTANYKRYRRDPQKLIMTDDVFREQESMGIIERIYDIDAFRKSYPNYSFLSHMSVFKMTSHTTKCRVVYLSNLCERSSSRSVTLSHNQTIHSGPNLNSKLLCSLLGLRFDEYMFTYDIKKAFLTMSINDVDSSRLLLMWFRNVRGGDLTPIYFKTKRVCFGIPCSPCLLMLALYKLLVLDEASTPLDKDDQKLLYHLLYMDNGAFTSNCLEDLYRVYDRIGTLFNRYKFSLQEFNTNNDSLQIKFDNDFEESSTDDVKLLGLTWNKTKDVLRVSNLVLDSAASTKRDIVSCFARNFDPMGFALPLLNRAKLFIHGLQCNSKLKWDDKLPIDKLKEWSNICKELNSANSIEMFRNIGPRKSEYKLVGFTDASKYLYGVVFYLVCANTSSVKFLCARNKVVSRQLEKKTIPALELNALVFGAEIALETVLGLCGPEVMVPVLIRDVDIYTDSMVALSWVIAYTQRFDHLQAKRSVFVMNRLLRLTQLCEKQKMSFKFVAGYENPADHVSRAVSYKRLSVTCYHSGPVFLTESCGEIKDELCATVPFTPPKLALKVTGMKSVATESLFDLNRYSKLSKVIRVMGYVYQFLTNLKNKLNKDISCENIGDRVIAMKMLIRVEQEIYVPECVNYCNNTKLGMTVPNLVSQLNLFAGKDGLLEVRHKLKDQSGVQPLIFLPRSSRLTLLIIEDFHQRLRHAGKNTVLQHVRREFYVSKLYSTVKRVLGECTVCRRMNGRTIRLNQSGYRDFRLNPTPIPFREMFIDHFGPYKVKLDGSVRKVWILLVTCLWSRAAALYINLAPTTTELMRTFQLHVYRWGVPRLVLSDLGSQLVAAAGLVQDFLKDADTRKYLNIHGISEVKFDQYFKGNHCLGGLVETLIKQAKRLVYGSIRNNVIDYFDFELIIQEVASIMNKRPIAFLPALRENSIDEIGEAISPEMLVHGNILPTVNCIPQLQPDAEEEEWTPPGSAEIPAVYRKLQKIRSQLADLYREEFLSTMVQQATDRPGRYKKQLHRPLAVGDVVLLKEVNTKSHHYPLARVQEVIINDLDEVTNVVVKKGGTGEFVKRHVNSVILLIPQTS